MSHAGGVRTRWLSVVAVGVLVATAGAGVALSQIERSAPPVASALASMPAETLSASVTDWQQIRSSLTARGGGVLLDRAYETDVSAVSVLGAMTPIMEKQFGWSVLDAQWEGLAQSRRGAAVIVQLPDRFDTSRVRESLGELGYAEPFESDGVWRGGTDLVAGIAPTLTPLVAHAVVLDDTRRVVFSDQAAYAGRAAAVVQGSLPSLERSEAVSSVGDSLEGAVAAVVHAGSQGCEAMGFRRASSGDEAAAARRVSAVGGVGRYAAIGMGLVPGGDASLRRAPLVVAMNFDGGAEASDEAERRALLATGEAPAQGGTFGARFAVSEASQRGEDVVLRLRPRTADAQLLSDLGSGQLLFATCGSAAGAV
jgi:hypothetical protein